NLSLRPATPPAALTIEKYASTPATTGAKSDDNGPVTSAMLPTSIRFDITPGAPPPELSRVTELEHPATTTARAATAATSFRRLDTIDRPPPIRALNPRVGPT